MQGPWAPLPRHAATSPITAAHCLRTAAAGSLSPWPSSHKQAASPPGPAVMPPSATTAHSSPIQAQPPTLPRSTPGTPPAADFRLDFYTEVQELGHLVAAMAPGPFSERYRKLSAGLADVVQEYGLLAFTPLAIQVGRAAGLLGCWAAGLLGCWAAGLVAEACFRTVVGCGELSSTWRGVGGCVGLYRSSVVPRVWPGSTCATCPLPVALLDIMTRAAARHGTARHGMARHGTARHSTAQHSTAPRACHCCCCAGPGERGCSAGGGGQGQRGGVRRPCGPQPLPARVPVRLRCRW